MAIREVVIAVPEAVLLAEKTGQGLFWAGASDTRGRQALRTRAAFLEPRSWPACPRSSSS
jgi:hypothetical protein